MLLNTICVKIAFVCQVNIIYLISHKGEKGARERAIRNFFKIYKVRIGNTRKKL